MIFEISVIVGILIAIFYSANCDSKLGSLYRQLKKISERLDSLESKKGVKK